MPASSTAPKRDNLFGVCAAIGEDFGFDPFWLRVALAVGVIAAPKGVLIGYACAALLVAIARLLTRDRRQARRGAEIRTLAPRAIADRIMDEPLRQAA